MNTCLQHGLSSQTPILTITCPTPNLPLPQHPGLKAPKVEHHYQMLLKGRREGQGTPGPPSSCFLAR